MTSFQRVIKYVAIAFAIFIIINIVSGIVFGISIFAETLGLVKNVNKEEIAMNKETTFNEVINTDEAFLKINVKYTNLVIKKGDFLKAETNNKYINCSQDKNKLVIEEKGNNWFNWNEKYNQLVIYIPENVTFETVKIEAGAGNINIENLNTKNLSFNIGAGKAYINKLTVTETAKIDGGAGKVDILSGTINNLKLNMGVGKFDLTSKLIGKNKISAGVGKLDINLLGNKEEYEIKTEKGLGSITIDGRNVSDSYVYGNSLNTVEIEGGVGAININFEN